MRKLVLEDFRDHVVTPLADGFPRMRSGKMAPRDRKDLARSLHRLLRPAEHMLDTELLRRLLFAATTADMYRRHNKELRHKVALARRDGVSVLRELRLRIAALEQQLKRARRESWCLAQTRLWEPHRNLHFIAKPLVLDEQQALARAAAEQPEQDDAVAAAAARPLRPRRAPQSPFLPGRREPRLGLRRRRHGAPRGQARVRGAGPQYAQGAGLLGHHLWRVLSNIRQYNPALMVLLLPLLLPLLLRKCCCCCCRN